MPVFEDFDPDEPSKTLQMDLYNCGSSSYIWKDLIKINMKMPKNKKKNTATFKMKKLPAATSSPAVVSSGVNTACLAQ